MSKHQERREDSKRTPAEDSTPAAPQKESSAPLLREHPVALLGAHCNCELTNKLMPQYTILRIATQGTDGSSSLIAFQESVTIIRSRNQQHNASLTVCG